ncbi:MAG: type IV pili methyl-accepting chemotaxis transducer N-terminal domain-containing protein [Helicobacteraceae bacterium]|jgi:nitrate/nitrite-specific signal transduction histidine kinase|nr:type IV pili methyl-accepting chemotaxis transducer N-terminal domain-containing protein [Helicobacteraceae bacterium]
MQLNNNGIIKQLVIIGAIVVICVVFTIVAAAFLNNKGVFDGYAINIAGRERMLSQKIAKEVFILNSQDRADFSELNLAIEEFQNGLHFLQNGNEHRNYAPTENKQIQRQLDEIAIRWADYKSSLDKFKTSFLSLDNHKRYIDGRNQRMLFLSDAIVKAMVIHKLLPQDIDDSGRQRMLTQRMGYHLNRYNTKWDTLSFEDFYGAYNLYDSTIKRFKKEARFRKYPDLAARIDETYEVWGEYSKHIKAILDEIHNSVDALSEIEIRNKEILREIEAVVLMYQEESIAIREQLLNALLIAAIVLVVVAIYAVTSLMRIKESFDYFTRKTSELLSGQASVVAVEPQYMYSELSKIGENISAYMRGLQSFETSADKLFAHSNEITGEISSLSDLAIKEIASLPIGDEERAKMQEEISRVEDMALQAREEIVSSSKLLAQLRVKLKLLSGAYVSEIAASKRKKAKAV